ncbi:hypothetical protein [Actinacidiphila sp. bgisy144]|uniref:hypothetical protein n=1 Tax=Actinacidiphila sp. bgisy144 TaxID=3413791 RepID=UPI003EB70AD0
MSPLDIVFLVSGVGYVLARRTLGEAPHAGLPLVAPVALACEGLISLSGAHPTGPAAATAALAGAGCLLSVAVGLARGAAVRIGERDGAPWLRYGSGALLLWLLDAALHTALALLGWSRGVLLAVGLGMVAETLVALHRAARAGRTAPGAPHDPHDTHDLRAPDGGRAPRAPVPPFRRRW